MNPANSSEGVALIVGASGGIGRAIATHLSTAGWGLALGYRSNATATEQLAAQLRVSARTIAVHIDVTKPETIDQCVANTHTELGTIGALVIASGPYIDMVHVSKLSAEQLAQQLTVDVVGAFAVVSAVLGDLRETQGSIIMLSTSATAQTAKKDVLSAVPKAAVEMLIRQLAVEEGRFGVRANGLGVGPITDGMYNQLVSDGYFTPAWLEAATSNLPLGRLGSADDIASAVTFLLSTQASWITGQTLMVDGGYSA